MSIMIRALVGADVGKVAEFSLRAWALVFESFEKVLGEDIYKRVYPDWLSSQASDVAQTCQNHESTTWIADDNGEPIGFVTVVFTAHSRDHRQESPKTAEVDAAAE
ncbi:hypothetical protein ACFQFC_06690 [Amorphoplanes digitatis]|uniref:Uncharacterized protein n=1 Tax=Actinoplanes digitatis TaxID=1868 RepID=A0A7W7HZY4_9ACTN|nr:hypothetical protein [Actinoplanes digitatis]MBB4763885.1 hypothetical protein [Actinoplanes digitatis]BFE73150.1 hypothetical protein GCM10020092_064510 [Actinoplanes digitatis]